MVSQLLFTALVVAVGLQRLVELRQSRHNGAVMFALGGREHAAHQMRWMVLLHAGWLLAMPLEVFAAGRPFRPVAAAIALGLFLAGQLLRRSARRALGWLWTTRIITVPGVPLVDSGPYRFLAHPNYLGVVLEIAALPLVHGAWLTSVVFSALNALVLWHRVEAEEAALALSAGPASRRGPRPAGRRPQPTRPPARHRRRPAGGSTS